MTPLVRRAGGVEALSHLGALARLCDELHLGLEEVHVQTQVPVELAQDLELGGGVVRP
jgi:hypothetical protein